MTGKLTRDFFQRPTLAVAQSLLGMYLVHRAAEGVLSGMIVETEAYGGPADPACHAHGGMTTRNAVMFGPAGHAYIYLVYGLHCCLNVVTEAEGFPAAVLIRAVEPRNGVRIMLERRGVSRTIDVANGPGKLCRALGIGRRFNGIDLCGNRLYIEDRGEEVGQVVATPRVGVKRGRDRLWRFYLVGSEYVSTGGL